MITKVASVVFFASYALQNFVPALVILTIGAAGVVAVALVVE